MNNLCWSFCPILFLSKYLKFTVTYCFPFLEFEWPSQVTKDAITITHKGKAIFTISLLFPDEIMQSSAQLSHLLHV